MDFDKMIADLLRKNPKMTKEQMLRELERNALESEGEKIAYDKSMSILDQVESAYEMPMADAVPLLKRLLKRDPNCLEAYEALAVMSQGVEEAERNYLKAIKIGDKKFGGSYLEEGKGHFWGLHETRAYMRCIYEMHNIHSFLDRPEESIRSLERLLELNESDNQGARYPLMARYIRIFEFEKAKKLRQRFDEQCTFFKFCDFYIEYILNGASSEAIAHLKSVNAANKYVLPLLIDREYEGEEPSVISPGKPSEAEWLASHFYEHLVEDLKFRYLLENELNIGLR